MTIQHVPDAQQDRRALLLLINDDRQLLLCGSCCDTWTIPSIHTGTGVEPAAQARQHLARTFGISNPQLAEVRGVHTSGSDQTWEYERITETHLLIYRITNEDARSACDREGGYSLWALEKLRHRRRQVSPQGVITFLAGFLEGWLPDGRHTLH
ncbi:hypothetical protein ACIQZN_25240 [Streptomyces sp. NPDC097595]|uniref:hypothetical protein n=1 Tax=Streptomyces sp. NPDC097595 TaxID=3366090 RepID=UPI003830302B